VLFEKERMHPFPAPAHYLVDSRECERVAPELPSVEGLFKATVAFHELLGSGWLRLRGAI